MKQPHSMTEPFGKALSWQKADGSFHVTDRYWRKRFRRWAPANASKNLMKSISPTWRQSSALRGPFEMVRLFFWFVMTSFPLKA